MSRKKQEVLSTHLPTTTEFQAFVSEPEKLNVIDCYPAWTGPCKSVLQFFKRLKLEAGSPRLRFGTACIDEIEDLQPYVNTKPEPLFLFYAEGQLVARIRGCHGPKLTAMTTRMLEVEENIANGEDVRIEIDHNEIDENRKSSLVNKDSYQSIRSNAEATTSSSALSETDSKQMTFSIITPNYLDHVEEIVEDLKSSGVELLDIRQVELTEKDVRIIIPNLESRDGWEDFLAYITSGASACMVLTRVGELGVGIVSQMNLLSGPADQTVAQKEAPDSINSLYGSMTIYTSDNLEQAKNSISHVFPNFTPPMKARSSTSGAGLASQFTIKGEITDEVVDQFTNAGLNIVERNDDGCVVSCQRSLNSLMGMVDGMDAGLAVVTE